MSLKRILFGRKPISTEAADLMLTHCVNNSNDSATVKFAELSGGRKILFLNKDRTFKIATVMLCMLSCERKDERFIPVRKRFEELVMPRRHDENFVQSYFAALSQLENLASSSQKHC
jgi:hypothetical protein